MDNFREKLKDLIADHDQVDISNTPDYVLARYLTGCLLAFEEAVIDRDEYLSENENNVL